MTPRIRVLHRVRIETGAFDDCDGWVAICDDLPEIVGRGDDEDEASADWIEKFEWLTLH